MPTSASILRIMFLCLFNLNTSERFRTNSTAIGTRFLTTLDLKSDMSW